MSFLIQLLDSLLRDSKHKKQWKVLCTLMASVVVFVTTYSLILPAITLENSAARQMDGIHLESAETTGAHGAEDDWETFDVLQDEAGAGKTAGSAAASAGDAGAGQQAPMIEAVLDDAMQPDDLSDGVLIEEDDGATGRTGTGNSAGKSAAAGEITAAVTFSDEVKTQASLRLEYEAEAMIPEGAVCRVTLKSGR